MKDFFDNIESNPLTPEQRLAVLTDEDASLVLAGAGSGKTSVIVAKATYLIERGIREPNEILLMAFGKDAATEVAARIKERSGASVDALTFHALGYEIIGQVEGGAPALAAHASDNAQFRALLRDILINDVGRLGGLKSLLLKWFSEFYWPFKREWDFKTKSEYYQYVESHDLRTLGGERVKSFEELQIGCFCGRTQCCGCGKWFWNECASAFLIRLFAFAAVQESSLLICGGFGRLRRAGIHHLRRRGRVIAICRGRGGV